MPFENFIDSALHSRFEAISEMSETASTSESSGQADQTSISQGKFLQEVFSESNYSRLATHSSAQHVAEVAEDVLLPIIAGMREASLVTVNGSSWTPADDSQVCKEYFAWATILSTAVNKFFVEVS